MWTDDAIASDWSMAASSDASDGLQQPPPLLMQHMQQQQQPGGGGQMAAMTAMGSPYYDHQQQFNMGPHSAPPVQKQHMPSFSYPPMGQERFMSGPSTSGQTAAPPSYYAAARPPPLNRTNSGQPRVQPVMGPPVPRKQLICVFSSELGNKAADDVRGQRIGSIIQWHHANVAPHASAQLRQQQQMLGASSLKRERPLSPLASSAPPSGAIPQQQRPPSRKTPQPRTPKTPSSVKQPTTPSGEATPANGQPPATSSSLPSTPVGAGSLCSSIDGVLSTSVDLSLSEDDNPLRKMERMTQEPGLFEPPNKLPRLSSPKEPNAMFMALGPSKCGSKASAAPSQQQSQMLAAPPQNGQQQPTSLDDNLTPEARRSREQKLEKLKAMERFLPSDPTMQQMGVSRPMMMNNGPPPHGMYPCPPQQQMQHMYRPHPQQNVLVAMNPSNAPGSRRSPSMDPNQADHQAAWDRMVHDYEMEKMKGMNAGQDMVQDPPMNDMFMAQRSKPVGMVPPNARTAHQHQQQRFGHPQMYPGGPLDGQFGNPPHQRMMGPPPGGAGYPRPMDPRFMSPHHPGVYYAPHPGGPAPPQMFPGDPADPYGMHPGKPSMMAGHNEMVGVYGGMGGANGPPPPRHYQPGMAQGPQQPHQPHQQQHQQPTVNNTFINAHVSMPQVNIQNIVPGPGQLGTMTVQQMTMHQHQQQQQQSMRPQGPIPMGAPMPPGSHAVMRPAQGGPGGQPPMYDYGPNGGSQDYSNCWPEPLTNLDSKVPSQKVQYYPATKQDPPPEFVGGFQGSMMTAQQIIKTDGQKVCMQQQANYASVSSSQQPPQQMQPHYDFQHQMYGQPAVRR